MTKALKKSFNPYSLIAGIVEFSKRLDLFKQNDSILLAVSGGIDSVVLLDAFASLRREFGLTLYVGHFNHCLRGAESDGDAEFVQQLAASYNIHCITGSADVKNYEPGIKRSLQEKARLARYRFLELSANECSAGKIAMAHNRDDQAETVFLQIIKGGSFEALQGIPAKRDQYIRPLLETPREIISAYVNSRRLKYREDSSNSSTKYDRNFVRLELFPLMKDYINKGFTKSLCNFGEFFSEFNSKAESSVRKLEKACVIAKGDSKILLDINKYKTYFNFEKLLLLKKLVSFLTDEETYLNRNFNSVLSNFLKKGTSGNSLRLSPSLQLFIDRERLVLIKIQPKFYSKTITIGDEIKESSPELSFQAKRLQNEHNKDVDWQEIADYDKCSGELTLRYWQKGDVFQPLGMNSLIRLKKFFINEKIPVFLKHSIPLLARGNEILWVPGYRISEKIKKTPLTKNIVGLYCDYGNK